MKKKLFSLSLDSDLIFYKNAPCQLMRLNFKNKSDFFNYDFSFKLSAITRLCPSWVASLFTYEFNFSMCEPR